MFWDKKKSHSLPDLPPYPPSVQMPKSSGSYGEDSSPQVEEHETEEDSSIHELPSFPDSPMQRGFSQSAIKEAVITDQPDTQEMPKVTFPKSNYRIQELQNPISEEALSYPPIRSKEGKAIFVKVDKFQTALSSLETVRSKLNEIEDLLKRIREVKNKEDQEISSWETEMENIKARIQSVMVDIFDKAEE